MINFQSSREARNDLLRILKTYTAVPFPSDCRSLLKTPKHTEIVPLCQGEYWHSGLEKAILEILKKREQINVEEEFVCLYVNVDGVPLGKSAMNCLWTILCADDVIKDVDVIGIYKGEGKPTYVNEFLRRFVDEAVKLVNEGVKYKEKWYKVRIHALVCDAPAKAYILQVTHHTGYSSCTKCMIHGDYVDKTVTFIGECPHKRTDEAFENHKYDLDYQSGTTCLVEIPFLGLVSNVPLDYMHLICLGIVRKLIQLWLSGPINKRVRLSAHQVTVISDRLLALRNWIPKDFNRKPRPLKFLKYWKATELRSFLLYYGPVVLRETLSSELYDHFMLLHVAITILVSPTMSFVHANVLYAEQLLNHFTDEFQKLYGDKYISHNVHNLRHLADDVKKFGALDEFGAFKFENCIGMLTKLVRKGDRPLQQIHRKIVETKKFARLPKKKKMSDATLSGRREFGILPNCQGYKFLAQYRMMQKGNYIVNVDDCKNNCIILRDGTIVNVVNFATTDENTTIVIGQKLVTTRDLYSHPIASSNFCINVVKKTNNIHFWPCEDIIGKMIKLPCDKVNDVYAVFPILHTVTNDLREWE